jgi:hypothetical protein
MNADASDNDGQGNGMDPRNKLYVHILEKLLYKFWNGKKRPQLYTLHPKGGRNLNKQNFLSFKLKKQCLERMEHKHCGRRFVDTSPDVSSLLSYLPIFLSN